MLRIQSEVVTKSYSVRGRLAEHSAAVRAPSVSESETAKYSDGEEEDGAQDAEAGEVFFEDADSAGGAGVDGDDLGRDDYVGGGSVVG